MFKIGLDARALAAAACICDYSALATTFPVPTRLEK